MMFSDRRTLMRARLRTTLFTWRFLFEARICFLAESKLGKKYSSLFAGEPYYKLKLVRWATLGNSLIADTGSADDPVYPLHQHQDAAQLG